MNSNLEHERRDVKRAVHTSGEIARRRIAGALKMLGGGAAIYFGAHLAFIPLLGAALIGGGTIVATNGFFELTTGRKHSFLPWPRD